MPLNILMSDTKFWKAYPLRSNWGLCDYLIWRKRGWKWQPCCSLQLPERTWRRKMVISSAQNPGVGHMWMIQSFTRAGSDWTSVNISLAERVVKYSSRLPRDVVGAPYLSVFKSLWTMSLIKCFNLWSSLKWSDSETRWSLNALSNWNEAVLNLFFKNCKPYWLLLLVLPRLSVPR